MPEIYPFEHKSEETQPVPGTGAISPRLAKLGLAVGVVTSGTVLGTGVAALTEHIMTPSCEAPSQQSVQEVTAVLEDPSQLTEPSVDNLITSVLQNGPSNSRILQEANARLGVTYPTFDERIWGLGHDYGNVLEDRPFQEYLDVTKDVLEQHGISLRIGVPEDYEQDAQTPTAQELETANAKNQMIQILSFFTSQPKELIALSGVTEIALTANLRADQSPLGGRSLFAQGTILIDIINNHAEDTSILPHEFGHFLDAALCDGVENKENDPAYAELNRRSSYANSYEIPLDFMRAQPAPFSTVRQEYYDLKIASQLAEMEGKDTAIEEVEEQAGELLEDIEMVSDYSYTFVGEDKAELGMAIFNPTDYSEVLDERSPVRRAKFLTLMARLHERSPGIVKSLALRHHIVLGP